MNPLSFGAVRSPYDNRTVTSAQVAPISPNLPQSGKVDFSAFPVSVRYDQFQVGECTSEAITKIAEYELKMTEPLNPDWGYLMTKVLIDGNLYEGSSALANLKRGTKYGFPTQAIANKYPLQIQNGYDAFINYFNDNYKGKIPQEIMDDAAKHLIPGYYQVTDLSPASLANQINIGHPLAFMIQVGDNTYTDANGNISWAAPLITPFRKPNPVTGAHLTTFNTYNALDVSQLLSGPNSWGLRWCPETQGYWSFIYGTYRPYLIEAWAISELPPVVVPQIQAQSAWYVKWVNLLKLHHVINLNYKG